MRGVWSVRAGRAVLIMACLLALEGCAAAALSVAGLAGGAGLQEFINVIVVQSFSSPISGTRLASLKTLKRMGMSV